MARTDSRQQARFQTVPVFPALPEVPSLVADYSSLKTEGLTRVFTEHDRKWREWATKTSQHLGRIQDALLKIGSSSGVARPYGNLGWARASFAANANGLVVTLAASTESRPESALLVFEVTESDSYGNARTLKVSVGESGSETNPLTVGPDGEVFAGLLRVALVPGLGWRDGSKSVPAVTDAVRTVVRQNSATELVCWLESAETDAPTPTDQLWLSAAYAELV